MSIPSNLNDIIQCILLGTQTDPDVETLHQCLNNGDRQNLQLGKYNVNIGKGKDIHIGDRIYQGADAEAIRKVLNEVIEALKFRTLLTHAEYLERMEQVAKPYQATYKGNLAGRGKDQEEIEECLKNDVQVIVLHGAGGLGKTRLLLSLKDLLPPETSLWYVRNEAESVESELTSLDRTAKHVIVVDDAHRCPFLAQFREVLVNPELANKVTLVLATRSVFKESVRYQLGTSEDRELEIKPLENQDIDELLQAQPYEVSNIETRHDLVRIAEGNPLIAGIAARLAQRDENLLHLSRDRLLTQYLDEILKDLTGGDSQAAKKYECYLQVIAVLGGIDLNDGDIRAIIDEVLAISPREEENIVEHLVESGLLEQYGSIIRLSSEVLGDRLLIMLLDAKGSKQNSLWRQLVEPFFEKKPKQILSSLATAELKGESTEAGMFLGQKLDEFRRDLKHEGNFFRFSLLDLLKEVAYFRPDDILTIVAEIVDAPEPQPETIQYQSWGTYSITHEMVLTKVVEVLKPTIYRGGIEGAIEYLHKLAIYQVGNQIYESVRSNARSALQKIADFSQYKPYDLQFLFLEKIDTWLEEDLNLNLSLCLALLHVMLQIRFDWTRTDPTEPHTIVFQQGDLTMDEFLERIRDRALDILYTAYPKVQELSPRLNIVQELRGAIPYLNSREDIPDATLDCIRNNCIKTATFFLEIAPNAEFPILEKIIDWLDWAKRFYKFQEDTLDHLKALLREHTGFQLYRLLVDGWEWNDELEHQSWEEAEKLRKQRIEEYVSNISLANLDRVIQELETIAQQAREAGKNNILELRNLLCIFGRESPLLAQQFIEAIVNTDSDLNSYLGYILAGISFAEPEVAGNYVRVWLESDNLLLWKAVANWRQPALEEEESIMRQLIDKNCPDIDLLLFQTLLWIADRKPETVIELLKILATRNHDAILQKVANVIAYTKGEKKQWRIQFQNPQDLLAIVQNFERLSHLDYDAQTCLERLGESHPMEVIKLLERRILARSDRHSRQEYYEAFPFTFSVSLENIRNHPEFPAVLRYIREWTLKLYENYLLYNSAPLLLKALSPGLEGELYNSFMEWIQSGDINKLKGIASTLRQFNSGQKFYEICREIILHAKQDESVLSSVSAAIFTTPGVISGGFSRFYKQRVEEIQPWLSDPDFPIIRTFAQKLDLSLKQAIEREEAREQLEERTWQ
jgi:Effector-associated domain 10